MEANGDVAHGSCRLSRKYHGVFHAKSIASSKEVPAFSSNGSPVATPRASSYDNGVPDLQQVNNTAARQGDRLGTLKAEHKPSESNQTFPVLFTPLTSGQLHERFVSAVISSISFYLCKSGELLSLNARTFLLYKPLNTRNNDSKVCEIVGQRLNLITLDVMLTSTGCLTLKLLPARCDGLAPILEPVSKSCLAVGTDLWLAFGGIIAKYLGYEAGQDEESDQTVIAVVAAETDKFQTYIGEYSIRCWKESCRDWLSQKGMNVDTMEAGGWLSVQVRTDSPTSKNRTARGACSVIMWPTVLCFQRTTSSDGISTGVNLDKISIPKLSLHQDPLIFAEDWFVKKGERDELVATKEKRRAAVAAAETLQADADSKVVGNASSPMALRRASIAAGVYPTPPDGIQQLTSATPAFEEILSTPSAVAPSTSSDHADAAMQSTVTDAEQHWSSPNGKRSAGLDFDDRDDNMFGDDNGDIFGDVDVTDADFSFFDDPGALSQSRNNSNVTLASENETRQDIDYRNTTILEPNISSADNGNPPTSVTRNTVKSPDPRPSDSTKSQGQEPASPQLVQVDESNDFKTVITHPKVASPPLSPRQIMKCLFADESASIDPTSEVNQTPYSADGRRHSLFDGVNFDRALSLVDGKYSSQGRFNCVSKKTMADYTQVELPMTDYLQRKRKRRTITPKFSKPHATEHHTTVDITEEADQSESDYVSDADGNSSDDYSDPDDTSHTSEEGNDGDVILTGRKRRMNGSDRLTIDGSFEDSTDKNEGQSSAAKPNPSAYMNDDSAAWSLAEFLSAPEPLYATIAGLPSKDLVAIAQIVADQARHGWVRSFGPDGTTVGSMKAVASFTGSEKVDAYNLPRSLLKAAQHCFDKVSQCTLCDFAQIQDSVAVPQNVRKATLPGPKPRANDPRNEKEIVKDIWSLPTPHLEVRRAETNLTIVPSAIPFWENLGLGPCGGAKDINAVCLYPKDEGMTDIVDAFLGRLRSTYESCKLGTHERLVAKGIEIGLTAFNSDKDGGASSFKMHAKEACIRLGKIMASAPIEDKNIVIYFVVPTDEPSNIVHACAAFHSLFEAYKIALKPHTKTPPNELVLQIVPMDFIASATSLVIPSPNVYVQLAFEVYDRCTEFGSSTVPRSILLEEKFPKSIDFRLSAEAPASLLRDNSCVHIAYSHSIDGRWISAAWTDTRGGEQMTASYCLGCKPDKLSREFSEIAHEMWETTMGMISARKINWRILISKTSVMFPFEMAFWKDLASTESTARISLTLLTFNTKASLQLLPPLPSIPIAAFTNQAVILSSPVTTPQSSSILSPDQFGSGSASAATPARDITTATTPSDTLLELEPDAVLVDVTDTTWGVVLSHRLNNSNSLLDFQPALISGYLVKRQGAREEDGLVVMEVNIVHADVVGTALDGLFREVLGWYGELGTLARARGVVREKDDVRPWHVVAAERATEILHRLL